MARRSGLGKGLSSLIPMEGGPGEETGALVEIPTASVSPEPESAAPALR